MKYLLPNALIEDPRPGGPSQMLKIAVAKFPQVGGYPVQERAKSLNRARRATTFEEEPNKSRAGTVKITGEFSNSIWKIIEFRQKAAEFAQWQGMNRDFCGYLANVPSTELLVLFWEGFQE